MLVSHNFTYGCFVGDEECLRAHDVLDVVITAAEHSIGCNNREVEPVALREMPVIVVAGVRIILVELAEAREADHHQTEHNFDVDDEVVLDKFLLVQNGRDSIVNVALKSVGIVLVDADRGDRLLIDIGIELLFGFLDFFITH